MYYFSYHLRQTCYIYPQGDIQGTYDAIDKESFTQTDRQVCQSIQPSLFNWPNNFATFKFFCVPLRKHVTYNKGFNRNIPHAKPSSSVIDEAPKQRNTGEVNVKSEIVNTI